LVFEPSCPLRRGKEPDATQSGRIAIVRQTGIWNTAHGAEAFGLERLSGVSWNFGTPALIERAVRRGEAQLSAAGALVGESLTIPATVLFVTEDHAGFDRDGFDTLRADMEDYSAGRELFAQDLHAGDGRIPFRLFAEHAWRALFAASSLERADRAALEQFSPEMTALDLPSFRPDRAIHGVSGPFVAVDVERGVVLSGGGASAATLVKAIADALAGAEAPAGNEIRLNAAVAGGQSLALIVGAEGAGKSSLAGPDALADGAISWSTSGLSGVAKPAAQAAAPSGFGSVVENAALDPETREPQSDGIAATLLVSGAPRPSDLFILARDGFGVLPPIARLDGEGAVRFMLLGYGSEISEDGPQATFDPGFGAADDLDVYGETLKGLIAERGVRCWLVNTGWVGPASDATRVPLEATRTLIAAAQSGALDGLERRASKMFGFEVPLGVPDVDPLLFQPRKVWGDKRAYLEAARELKAEFESVAERLGLSAQDAGDDDEAAFREAAE
jgi:phosphoenolpyruvate carboxykinase (ATP)